MNQSKNLECSRSVGRFLTVLLCACFVTSHCASQHERIVLAPDDEHWLRANAPMHALWLEGAMVGGDVWSKDRLPRPLLDEVHGRAALALKATHLPPRGEAAWYGIDGFARFTQPVALDLGASSEFGEVSWIDLDSPSSCIVAFDVPGGVQISDPSALRTIVMRLLETYTNLPLPTSEYKSVGWSFRDKDGKRTLATGFVQPSDKELIRLRDIPESVWAGYVLVFSDGKNLMVGFDWVTTSEAERRFKDSPRSREAKNVRRFGSG